MVRIPLIEIKNFILLKFASDADASDNKNGLIDTSKELSIFTQKSNNAIQIGLCSQNDLNSVLKLDGKKIKTQDSFFEVSRNSSLKSLNGKKDYDEQYYKDTIKKCKEEIKRFKNDISSLKKELEVAQREMDSVPEYITKARTKAIDKKFVSTAKNVCAFEALLMLPIALACPEGMLAMSAFALGGAAFADAERKSNTTTTEQVINPAYQNAMNHYNDINTVLQAVENSLNKTEANLDLTVKQNSFLDNMDNFVKMMDQRSSYIKKLNSMSEKEINEYMEQMGIRN